MATGWAEPNRKTGKGYVARWRQPDGKTRSKAGFRLKADAAKFADRQADAVAGSYVDPAMARAGTLADLVPAWLDSYRFNAAWTQRTRAKAWRTHIGPELGALRFDQLTTPLLMGWLDNLRERGLSYNYRQSIRQSLSTLLDFGVKADVLARNPIKGERTRRDVADGQDQRAAEVIPPTDEELAAIIEAFRPRRRVAALIAAYCGLRSGEVRGLRVEDVTLRQLRVAGQRRDLDGADVLGRTKTNTSVRKVPLPTVVREAIAAHLATYGPGPGGVILTTEQGRQVPGNTIERWMRDAVTAAGVRPDVTFHDLRHYYATGLLADPELSTYEVARLIGHKGTRTLEEVYGHQAERTNVRAEGAVDRLVRDSARHLRALGTGATG